MHRKKLRKAKQVAKANISGREKQTVTYKDARGKAS
jgi:hypothetical protein